MNRADCDARQYNDLTRSPSFAFLSISLQSLDEIAVLSYSPLLKGRGPQEDCSNFNPKLLRPDDFKSRNPRARSEQKVSCKETAPIFRLIQDKNKLVFPAGFGTAVMPITGRSHRRHVHSAVPPSAPPTTTSAPNANPSAAHPATVPSQPTPRVSTGFQRVFDPGHVSRRLAPPWPFNPQETALIRAGYRPAFKPDATTLTEKTPASGKDLRGREKMAEPRARAARHKGQMNFAAERWSPQLLFGNRSKPHYTKTQSFYIV